MIYETGDDKSWGYNDFEEEDGVDNDDDPVELVGKTCDDDAGGGVDGAGGFVAGTIPPDLA